MATLKGLYKGRTFGGDFVQPFQGWRYLVIPVPRVAAKRGNPGLWGVTPSAYFYDKGGVGDSNLTKVTLHPGAEPNRVTLNYYDWRDRLVATKTGLGGDPAQNNKRK